jgi:hypothetical protein
MYLWCCHTERLIMALTLSTSQVLLMCSSGSESAHQNKGSKLFDYILFCKFDYFCSFTGY